ncbi:MAG: hemolysin III family protein [Christensenellaceae bacterium]|jgi:hemolysin III|nr:hemolysin III family protein [Christensenellaceae bacterium]
MKTVKEAASYNALRLFSALTHGIGAYLSSVAAAVLITRAVFVEGVWHVVSFALYSATLIALYSASTLYHSIPAKPAGRTRLRKLDHIMIFLLIAGTYTPICLVTLRAYSAAWGWAIFGVVWGFAAGGTLMKLLWLDAPRWLYTAVYLGMGWLVVVAIFPLSRAANATTLALLGAGGAFYTAGAILYALQRPGRENPLFGFHEVFHIFVIAGSVCHFVMMFFL